MRKVILGGIAAALSVATATAVTASAAGQSTEKLTGGGQIDVPTSGGGPGDTLALQAQLLDQSDTTATRGQVQYTPHATDATAWHGTVTCFDNTGPNQVTLTGPWTAEDGTTGTFKITVQDTDAGAPQQQGADVVSLDANGDSDCTQPLDPQGNLGHGNFQLHNAPSS